MRVAKMLGGGSSVGAPNGPSLGRRRAGALTVLVCLWKFFFAPRWYAFSIVPVQTTVMSGPSRG